MNQTIAAALLVLLAGCAPAALSANSPAAQPASPAPTTPAERGLAFASMHCARCHAVSANGVSSNPESPPFADVANTPGLTSETFHQFLSDSHNFPAAMNFTVGPAEVDDLAAYMLTLRKPGYQPQQ